MVFKFVQRKDEMINEEFLDRTVQEWQPLTDKELTREDAREIIQNACDLFDLLNKIKMEIAKNENQSTCFTT